MTQTYWLIAITVASVLAVYFGVNKVKNLSIFSGVRKTKKGDVLGLGLSLLFGVLTTIPAYVALGISAWIGLSVALGHSMAASTIFVLLKKYLKTKYDVDIDETQKEEKPSDVAKE